MEFLLDPYEFNIKLELRFVIENYQATVDPLLMQLTGNRAQRAEATTTHSSDRAWLPCAAWRPMAMHPRKQLRPATSRPGLGGRRAPGGSGTMVARLVSDITDSGA